LRYRSPGCADLDLRRTGGRFAVFDRERAVLSLSAFPDLSPVDGSFDLATGIRTDVGVHFRDPDVPAFQAALLDIPTSLAAHWRCPRSDCEFANWTDTWHSRTFQHAASDENTTNSDT
jgi:hypothetical protein